MSLTECLYVSIFGMSVVFVVLIGLCILVTVQSVILKKFSPKKQVSPEIKPTKATFSPDLTLIDVDEKTAAMIIAIVCDESGFAPEELNFKTIRQI